MLGQGAQFGAGAGPSSLARKFSLRYRTHGVIITVQLFFPKRIILDRIRIARPHALTGAPLGEWTFGLAP
jgi:hypothetical protein